MNKSNSVWLVIVVLLFASNGYALYQNYTTRKNFRWQMEISNRVANAQRLSHQNIPATLNYWPVNKGAGELLQNLKSNKYSLLVLFEPNQCGSCLNEKILWNDIYQGGKLPIYGLTYLKDRKELEQFLGQTGVKMPVYQDSSAIIGQWLLPNGVPVKLLVDSGLNILWADYVRDSPEKRQDFNEMLTYYLRKN